MPIHSRWTLHRPQVSLQTWMFGSPSGPLPDRVAFADAAHPDVRYLTYCDFRLWAKRVALGLQNAGLHPGDRVCLFSSNDIFYAPIMVGVLMAGGVFTGASPAFTSRELSHQIVDSGAVLLVAATTALDVALDAAALAQLPTTRIYAFDGHTEIPHGADLRGLQHWSALLAAPADAHPFQWFEPSDTKRTVCCLNYSSGTTGVPKGVEISHYAYVAHSEMLNWHRQMDPRLVVSSGTQSTLCFTPLYHAMGQSSFIFAMPKLGVSVYVMRAYNFEKMLEHIQELKITLLMCVPAIMQSLAKNPLRKKYDLSSVRDLTCGTAPLAPDTAREVERLWPGDVVVRQGWGMTEVTCVGTICDPASREPDDSVGEVTPDGAIKLVDGQGREITQANTPGELWFTGPTLMNGYWRNAKATQETIVDEGGTLWLRSGDIAYVDKYGPGAKVRLVDRIKELIKVKGYQVAPAELEAVILEHKDVADAGVVGVVINGHEVPRAYVRKTETATISAADIEKWVEKRVATYKWLKGGVALVDSIPRLQSGKILRRVLRSRAQEEVGDRVKSQPMARLA